MRGPRGSWLDAGVAAAAGLLYALVFPPYALAVWAWACLVPLLWLLRGTDSAGRGALLAGVFAFAAELHTASWVPASLVAGFDMSTGTAWVVHVGITLYVAFWFAVFGALAVLVRRAGVPAVLGTPCAFLVSELGREALGDGMPWELLGHSQWQTLAVLQVAELGGVAAISFVLVCANAAWVEVLAAWRSGAHRRALGYAGLAVGLPVAVVALGTLRLHAVEGREEAPAFRLGIVQAAIPQRERWDEGTRRRNFEEHLRLTREAVAGGAELVVWSETAVDFFPEDPAALRRQLADALGNDPDRWLLLGLPRKLESQGREAWTNAAVVVDGAGNHRGHYDKIRLLPLAEKDPDLLYAVPGARRVLARLTAGDPYAAGSDPAPLRTPWANVGALICFEAIYSQSARATVEAGADVLVNISNDAYFATQASVDQHLAGTVARAVETRRPLVRVVNGGVGAVVAPSGRILERIERDETRVVVVDVSPGGARTPWLAGGYLLPWLALGVVAVASAYGAVRPRTR